MPINFNLQQIKDDFGCNLYFETGLWNVEAEDTSLCKAITMDFDKCFSVEINPDLRKQIELYSFLIHTDMDTVVL